MLHFFYALIPGGKAFPVKDYFVSFLIAQALTIKNPADLINRVKTTKSPSAAKSFKTYSPV